MTQFDLPTLINWLASGFIGFIFGVAGTWVSHRYERIRDDIAWKREKEKLEKQFEFERALLETQFNQKLEEIEKKVAYQQSTQIRQNLLQGIEDPEKVIRNYKKMMEMRLKETENVSMLRLEPNDSFRSSWFFLWSLAPEKIKLSIRFIIMAIAVLLLVVILLIGYILMNL